MPKVRLTDITIRNLPIPDAGTVSYIDSILSGFAVRVSPSGVKAFTLVHGKDRRRENLGRWPTITLAAARKRAGEILATHMLGLTRESPRMTFEAAFTLFMTTYEAKNRPKSVYEMKRLINRHLMPKLKRRDLSEITTQDVATAIEKLIPTHAECKALFTASRTLFRWMEKRRLIERSPISGLDAPTRVVSRDHVLTDEELGKVLSQAIQEPASYARIVELLIRTGQRVKQISHLRAEWVDYDRKTITWPREIMKSKREHTIPFPEAVAAILEDLPKEGLLFPARGRDTPFNGFSKSKVAFDGKLENIAPYTLHDFRRNLSSQCAAMGIDPLTVERILAHTIPGIAGVYNRFSYLEPMRTALEAYEQHLSQLTGT